MIRPGIGPSHCGLSGCQYITITCVVSSMWKCRTCRSCDRPFNFHLPLIGGARKKHKKIQPHGSCSCCPCADVALAPALTLCDLAPDWPIAAAEVLIDLSSSASATYKNKKGSHACLSWRSTEQEGITCPNSLFPSSPPSSFFLSIPKQGLGMARPMAPIQKRHTPPPVQCQWVHTVQAAGVRCQDSPGAQLARAGT